MIEGLKPFYNNSLRPAVRLFAALRISPDQVTVAGTALFAAAGWFTLRAQWHVALGLVVCGALLDGLDGLLARETGRMSTFGAVLDSACDRLSEVFWFAGLIGYYLTEHSVTHPLLSAGITFAASGASLMISYIKARCEGAGVDCRVGILQRPERLIVICFCLLLGEKVMFGGMIVLAALGWFTFAQRMVHAYRVSKK
ncbi:MAG: CDP-alcohol phosphatidyltransferase family protein [Chitinivibrionales bacterium]|nr:CDP-alcohol phosphatidyltransferase family protein [Chitinivibrionales bacterium]